jgi:hypothetical protein
MSQRDVERTIGRLLNDDGFRQDLFLCLALGVHLAPQELEALLRVSRARLAGFAAELDDRIRRLFIEDPVE